MTRSALVSRRRFLATTAVAAAGGTLLLRAPAALGQQMRELNVWHTEVEAQTVKTIQDTSIAEFERKFPGFKVKQQALGWGDLNTKLLASLASPSRSSWRRRRSSTAPAAAAPCGTWCCRSRCRA